MYYSIYSFYYSIHLSELCSLSMRNMGSPRKDNPLTNAEIKCRWQEKNRDKDLTKKREAYAQKQQFLPKK